MGYKRFGALTSSVDNNKLAATVQGILTVLGGSVGFFVTMGLIDMASSIELVKQVEILLQQITVIVSAGVTAWGAAQSIMGIARKILVAINSRFSR